MTEVISAVSASLLLWLVILGAFYGPKEKDLRLHDGRTVHCLVQPSGFGDSLSCDWANAKVKP